MVILDNIIVSNNITLKTLNTNNVSNKYSNWLNDKGLNQYTEARFSKFTKEDILNYIDKCNNSKNSLLLGIFVNDEHIGNVKADINFQHLNAGVGILIGDKISHSKGIGCKVINIFTDYLFKKLNIFKVNAGIYETNIASRKAFEKAGFKVEYIKKNHVINITGNRENVDMMVKYANS